MMDLQQILNTPTRPARLPEIPNTPDIPTPPSRASTQSWDSQNGPRPDGSMIAELDSQSSRIYQPSQPSANDTLAEPTTPLRRNLETSRDKRLQIQTALLFNVPYDEIRKKLGVTNKQIWRAKHSRLTPQKSRAGRHALLNTPQKTRLSSGLRSLLPTATYPGSMSLNCLAGIT